MVRITRGNVAAKRRKKDLKLARGYSRLNSRSSIMAKEQIVQSLNFAYIGRRLKKRTFRRVWVYRINTATRSRENIYSIFIGCLRDINIFLNRKLLSFIAFTDFVAFNLLERESRKSNIFQRRLFQF